MLKQHQNIPKLKTLELRSSYFGLKKMLKMLRTHQPDLVDLVHVDPCALRNMSRICLEWRLIIMKDGFEMDTNNDQILVPDEYWPIRPIKYLNFFPLTVASWETAGNVGTFIVPVCVGPRF